MDFAHVSGLPVCGYRLDAADAEPAVFVECVVAALRLRYGEVSSRTLGMRREGRLDVEAEVGSLGSEIDAASGENFVLWLDDYHLVDEPSGVSRVVGRDPLVRWLQTPR